MTTDLTLAQALACVAGSPWDPPPLMNRVGYKTVRAFRKRYQLDGD